MKSCSEKILGKQLHTSINFPSSTAIVKSNRENFTRMIHIHFSLILYQFTCLLQSAYSSNKPFIFNPHTLEIYDVGGTSMAYEGGPYAVACPANDEHENDFNERFSLNHKSLFVRHYSNAKDDFIHQIRCKSRVQLAVAHYNYPGTRQKFLKFGYEGFIWISKTSLQFNESKWDVNNLSYSIHKDINWPGTKCNNYELHEELYKKWSPDDFYSSQHQEKIFSSVQLAKDDCESKTLCVQKYTLVPAYVFQSGIWCSVSCTNLTTVPIWSKTTAPLLDYLNKFLFAIAQITDTPFRIYPELVDTLVLPTIDGTKPTSKYIYLHPKKKKLAIPRLILKLVVYRTYRCDTSKFLCWFQVIIVIHNEPTVTNKLCGEDKCEQLGWASIQYQDKKNPQKKSQHIYCCEMNKLLMEIFMGSTKEKFIHKNLDLKYFPRFNKDTYGYEYGDEFKQIEHRVSQWYEDTELFEPQNP